MCCIFQLEAMEKAIDRYSKGAKVLRDKLMKLKIMRRKIVEATRRNEVLILTTSEDAAAGNDSFL